MRFRSAFGSYKFLWSYLKLYRTRIGLSLVSLSLGKGMGIEASLVLRRVVNHWSDRAELAVIPALLIVLYGGFRLLDAVFSQSRELIFERVAHSTTRLSAIDAFRHALAIDLQYHIRHGANQTTRVLERGLRGVDEFLTFAILSALPTLVEVLFVLCIVIYRFGLALSFIISVTIAVYLALTIGITEWRGRMVREMRDAEHAAHAVAAEALEQLETVKNFGAEDFESGRYDEKLRLYERVSGRTERALAVLKLAQAVTISGGMAMVLFVVAHQISIGLLKVGDAVLINGLLLQVSIPLSFLGVTYREMKRSIVEVDGMIALMNVPVRYTNELGPSNGEPIKGSVEFRDVSFSYGNSDGNISGLSFRLDSGKSLGIVGSSGSGKSTIVKMVAGLLEARDGQIMLGGEDITKLNRDVIHRSIGVVSQDSGLFNASVFDNIVYNRSGIHLDEVIEAAKIAQVHDIILKLPRGYDSVIGSRGMSLSGGERQRICIARAILRKPQILILDEATSALDYETERVVQDALAHYLSDRTRIIAAHRLTTLSSVDEIIVLREGSIVERGSHARLLAEKGIYYALWMTQDKPSFAVYPA